MRCELSNQTVFRIERIVGKPITKGMDKTFNEILDRYVRDFSN